MGKCGGGIRAKEIAYANLQKLYSLALIPHSLYDLRHREARAALDSPLTPCTTTGTKQPVLHSSPPPHSLGGFCTLSLTPCMTSGTEQSVLHSSPPLTPCMTIYRHQAARAALESPPSLPVRLQAPSSPCCTRVPPPPPSLPVRLQAQSRPCCTRVPPPPPPPPTPYTTTGTEQPVLHSTPPLTPCTTTGKEQFCLSKNQRITSHNKRLSSIGKCILSVVPSQIQKEVFVFDELRNKVKTSTIRQSQLHMSNTKPHHKIREFSPTNGECNYRISNLVIRLTY